MRGLLLNTSYSESPYYYSLREHVSVAGLSSTEFACLDAELGEHARPCDFRDQQALSKAFERESPDLVISSSHDDGWRAAAALSQKHGLPGYDSLELVLAISDKLKFRELGAEAIFELPQRFSQDRGAALSSDGKSLAVKPPARAGSAGVSLTDSLPDYQRALESAARWSDDKSVVVEERITGPEISVSVIVNARKVSAAFFDIEYSSPVTHRIDASWTTQDPLIRSAAAKARAQLQAFTQQFDLVDGPLHGQFIVCPDRGPVLLELTRRPPGDLYFWEVQAATGIDWSAAAASLQFGLGLPRATEVLFDGRELLATQPFFRFVLGSERIGALATPQFALSASKHELRQYRCYSSGYRHDGNPIKRTHVVHVTGGAAETWTRRFQRGERMLTNPLGEFQQ